MIFLLRTALGAACACGVLFAASAAAADAVAPDAPASAAASAPLPATPTTPATTAATAPAAPASAASAAATAAAPTAAASAPVAAALRPAPAPRSRKSELVQISDPYIELRSGPGRGYPIFFVAPRSDWIEIELRHTDWFRVRTEDNKVGWVSRQQLESTLTAAGGSKTFRDVLLDDYLSRKVQLGAAWGHFKSEPMLKLWTSYRLSDTLSLEGTIGQVQGVFSGTDLWHIDLLVEPWSDHRVSPFFGVGVGKFKNFPNLSLIGATDTNAKLAVARVGLRYYLSERFVMSGDYSLYTAFINDQHSTEYRAWTLGLSFFF
ncbi:MAG TPA: SH3 domain-containing protein [Caldimonas sp.]|nr:SH3 domain-containing protein [Caldimonas sp.]